MYDLLLKLFLRLGMTPEQAQKIVASQKSFDNCPNGILASQRRRVTMDSIVSCNTFLNEVCSQCSSNFSEGVVPCDLPLCQEAYSRFLLTFKK